MGAVLLHFTSKYVHFIELYFPLSQSWKAEQESEPRVEKVDRDTNRPASSSMMLDGISHRPPFFPTL